jgi:hypothetical protein
LLSLSPGDYDPDFPGSDQLARAKKRWKGHFYLSSQLHLQSYHHNVQVSLRAALRYDDLSQYYISMTLFLERILKIKMRRAPSTAPSPNFHDASRHLWRSFLTMIMTAVIRNYFTIHLRGKLHQSKLPIVSAVVE